MKNSYKVSLFPFIFKSFVLLAVLLFIASCVGPRRGPDKRVESALGGILTGAGAGAVTGVQVGAGTGPGILVGAGFGAALGSIQGYLKDQEEESLLDIAAQTKEARQVAYAQEVLTEHFKRRSELHPTRDIFPADLFFFADTAKIKPEAIGIIKEIVRLNKNRLPWSRLIVSSYVKADDEESTFGNYLAGNRAKSLANLLIRYGIEPRRIKARGILLEYPILVDPDDRPNRYSQAIELTAADR